MRERKQIGSQFPFGDEGAVATGKLRATESESDEGRTLQAI